jgi:FkbM family methyltransferase|tara:strand:- start:2 stop:178 length:177 start_codon:yes stop_codon:yes gene_type:complete
MRIKETLIKSNQCSLDTIIIKYKIKDISFIKLDVDGSELDVLKSGEKLLLKNHLFSWN